MNVFSMEEQLLLHSLHCLISGEPFQEVAAVNWDTAVQLATSHKLTPILHNTIPAGLMPTETAAKLAQAARQQRIRTAVLIEDFQAIHAHLVAAGIRVIPLKGIALAHTVYPSPSLRYFDDIDILVPAESASAALTALQQLGYVVHPNAPKPDWHHLPPHIHPKHGTMVEIHTDLFRRGRPGWNIAEIWSRAEPGRVAGQETWLLSTADALIYTALHARHNLFNRLSFFVDAALLVYGGTQEGGTQGNSGELAIARPMAGTQEGSAFRSPEQSAQLAKLGREAGAQNALGHLLSTAQRLFALSPSPQLVVPASSRLAKRIAGWQTLMPDRDSLRQGPLPRLMELLLMDSWGDSLWLGGRLLFPPAEFVSEGYGQDTAGYGKRIWQRAGLAAGQLVKLVRGR